MNRRATLAASGAGAVGFIVLTVAGGAMAAPAQKNVSVPAETQFTLACSTHSTTAVPDAIETYMEARAVVGADGKTHWAQTFLINGKEIDPKLATAKVTVTELANQGGYMYELDGQLNEDSEATPNEFCHDTQIYRSKAATEAAKPIVTVTEAQPVSVGK